MSFNHCIIFAENTPKSASFHLTLFDLPESVASRPFVPVTLGHGVVIQYAAPGIEIQPQHYAFLVSEEEFDVIYARLLEANVEHSADPQCSQPGAYNRNHGGRGVYFRDPAGHGLEVMTRPENS